MPQAEPVLGRLGGTSGPVQYRFGELETMNVEIPQLNPVLARSLWRSDPGVVLEPPGSPEQRKVSYPSTPVLARATALAGRSLPGPVGRRVDQPFSSPSAFHHEKSVARALAREGRSHYGASGVGQLDLPIPEEGYTIPVVTIASTAISSGVLPASGWMTSIIPVIGPIIAGVTFGISKLFNRQGPRQKVATTLIVDKVEPLLQQNLNGYMSGPRNISSQAQALANFDAGWTYVVNNCQIPEMGDPGIRCVRERQAGGQWDWFARYRDPIANDTQVSADAVTRVTVDPVTGQVVPSSGASMIPLLLAGGLLMLWMVNK